MEDYTISLMDVVGLLVGGLPNKYSVHCEENHDRYLIKNRLPRTFYIAEDLLYELSEIGSTWRNDHRGSAKVAARYCDERIGSIVEYLLANLPEASARQICKSVLSELGEVDE